MAYATFEILPLRSAYVRMTKSDGRLVSMVLSISEADVEC